MKEQGRERERSRRTHLTEDERARERERYRVKERRERERVLGETNREEQRHRLGANETSSTLGPLSSLRFASEALNCCHNGLATSY